MAYLSKTNTRITVDAEGKVGIGTDFPAADFHVQGSSLLLDSQPTLVFKDKDDDTTNSISLNAGNLYIGGDAFGRNVIFRTKEFLAETARFDSAGRLGINRVPVNDFLEVDGNIVSHGGMVKAFTDLNTQARLNSAGGVELISGNALLTFRAAEANPPAFTLQGNGGNLNFLSGENIVGQLRTGSIAFFAQNLQAGLTGERGTLVSPGSISLWNDTQQVAIDFKDSEAEAWRCKLKKDSGDNLEIWVQSDTLISKFERNYFRVYKGLIVTEAADFSGGLVTTSLQTTGETILGGVTNANTINATYGNFSHDVIVESITANGLATLNGEILTDKLGVYNASSSIVDISIEAASNVYESTLIEALCWRTSNDAFSFLKTYSDSDGAMDVEHDLKGDGNAYADGAWIGGGADYADYFEWADGNPDNEDRKGVTVTIEDDKIKATEKGEVPIGVISRIAVVVGNSGWNKWADKYLRDAYGSYKYEQGERIPNPEYNPDIAYVPREKRPEWDPVGLVGRVRVKKGQITSPHWIKLRDVSDEVEEWLIH